MRCVRHVSEESKKSKVEVKTSALSPQSPEQQVANTKGVLNAESWEESAIVNHLASREVARSWEWRRNPHVPFPSTTLKHSA